MTLRCMKQSIALMLLLSSVMVRLSSSSLTTGLFDSLSVVVRKPRHGRSVLAFASCPPAKVPAFASRARPKTFLEFRQHRHDLREIPRATPEIQGRSISITSFQTSLCSTSSNDNQNKFQSYSTSLPLFIENDDNEQPIRRPQVQWYPGHIAKAERQLAETLKVVDVVVEVRDSRACKATSHPRVGEWCAGRPRIVVLTHVDQIPKVAMTSWKRAYDKFGAHGTLENEVLNYAQVLNQAKQNQEQRQKFNPKSGNVKVKSVKKNHTSNKGNKNKSKAVISPVEQVLFVDAKQGQGIHALHRAIFKAGSHVQERREKRGLKERPLRVGIIGYPNVGKSALINRILGRKRARTANTPGVTRSLQWIRVRTDEDISTGSVTSSSNKVNTAAKRKKEFELLDSPGIIPAKMVDQSDAILLAACNCIGQAAYDNQAVAAYLFEWLKTLHMIGKGNVTSPAWRQKCQERYGFDPLLAIPVATFALDSDDDTAPKKTRLRTGEDMLFQVADNTCRGDPEDASRKILQDFRTGRLGHICLQVAPETEDDEGQLHVPVGLMDGRDHERSMQDQREELLRQEREERARRAVELAKERGLELPPNVADSKTSESKSQEKDDGEVEADTVGKGLFDGW